MLAKHKRNQAVADACVNTTAGDGLHTVVCTASSTLLHEISGPTASRTTAHVIAVQSNVGASDGKARAGMLLLLMLICHCSLPLTQRNHL